LERIPLVLVKASLKGDDILPLEGPNMEFAMMRLYGRDRKMGEVVVIDRH
jgi:hypothetical protein